jgi:hypothetical protein
MSPSWEVDWNIKILNCVLGRIPQIWYAFNLFLNEVFIHYSRYKVVELIHIF